MGGRPKGLSVAAQKKAIAAEALYKEGKLSVADIARNQNISKATLYSYVINHRPAAPGFTPPYAIAVVELDEGPRMMSNILDCPQTPEALVLDMKLEVAFEKLDDKITLPLFRPAKG